MTVQWTWNRYQVDLEPNESIVLVCDLAIENNKRTLAQAVNITSSDGSGIPIAWRSTDNLGDNTYSKTQLRVGIKTLDGGTLTNVRLGLIAIGY